MNAVCYYRFVQPDAPTDATYHRSSGIPDPLDSSLPEYIQPLPTALSFHCSLMTWKDFVFF